MNLALVDPIAATANLTGTGIFRPRVPSLGRDPAKVEETKIVEIATQFARRGHHPTVLFGDAFLDGDGWTTPAGVRVAPVSTMMRFPFHPGLLPAIPSLIGHPALLEADVIQVAEFHQLSTFFSCLAAQGGSIPIVVWQETFRHMRFPGSLYQRMFESSVGSYVRDRTQRFVPRTSKAREYLRGLHVSEDRLGPWIPTGIDTNTFVPRAPRLSPADFGWDEDSRILLLVGRLHPTKGIDTALRTLKWVMRRHPDTKLAIRGSGPEKGALVRLAKDLGIESSVRFLERMPREAVVDLYNLADLVICSSRVDLMPFSLIEASACGRPSVAMDVGAIRDIVVDGLTGRVVVDRTATGLGTATCALLEDRDTREALGSAARERAEQFFALPVIAEALLEVYRNVAS